MNRSFHFWMACCSLPPIFSKVTSPTGLIWSGKLTNYLIWHVFMEFHIIIPWSHSPKTTIQFNEYVELNISVDLSVTARSDETFFFRIKDLWWCLCVFGLNGVYWSILHPVSKNWISLDLFHTKTDLFSTRALIWVHFKNVNYFSQPIFSLFSY